MTLVECYRTPHAASHLCFKRVTGISDTTMSTHLSSESMPLRAYSAGSEITPGGNATITASSSGAANSLLNSLEPSQNTPSAGSYTPPHTSPGINILPTNQQSPPTVALHLILGTEGRKKWSLSVDQVQLMRWTTGGDAINKIMQTYRSLRGPWRLWLSVYKLDTCIFTAFRKYRRDRVKSSTSEEHIPQGDDDYEYEPQKCYPPTDERPLIDRSEFKDYLNFCQPSCWLNFSPWHECNPPSEEARLVVRVPKKRSPWLLDIKGESTAWGVQCTFEISGFRVFIWHVVIFALPFSFWAWWQNRHPDDVQSAAVPLALVIAGVAAFWQGAGVLKAPS